MDTHTGYEEWILRALRRIIRAVDLHSRRLSHRYKLTTPQLVCLRQISREGPMRPGTLARRVSLSPATVTGILDRLEKRGLVGRERSQEDRRKVWLSLTPAGRELVEEAPLPLNESFRRRLDALSEEEQLEIERVLTRIIEMMEAEDLDAAPLLSTGSLSADPESVSVLPSPR